MASIPDDHPDSAPTGPSEDVERVAPASTPDRESVEDSPGTPGGTAGTGGESIVQDEQFER